MASIYEQLGVRRLVNAQGQMTMLGGSVLTAKVEEAMKEANRYFVDMEELMKVAGKAAAEATGAEAGYVTPGACAALALGAAACMTGSDTRKMEAVPRAGRMKNEIIIQKVLRVKYDRCVTVPGARLVEVGNEAGTTPQQIEAAIGPKTAAIHYLAPGRPGAVPLEEVLKIAKRHGVPVIVDAAGQVYPPENLKRYVAMGADLVCYGAKYFMAPNSSGLLVGRKDLVEAAALQGFISFETNNLRVIGRPMKLDRQEIVAVIVALREWMTMDHQARLAAIDKRVRRILEELKGIPGLTATPQPEGPGPASGVLVTLDQQRLKKTAAEVVKALRDGDPCVRVGLQDGRIWMRALTLVEGDEKIIGERFRAVLAGK